MFQHIAQQTAMIIAFLQQNTPYILAMIGGLYLIHIINFILAYHLNALGIYPRKVHGLIGIVFAPFLHANFNHLFFNTIPLFVLSCLVLLSGWTQFIWITSIIVILSGIMTWFLGRKGLHIGASGLVMGYWSYLLINAYHQGTALSIALAVICAYYFGSLVLSLFPQSEKTSWEGHIFGFMAGLAAAYMPPLSLLMPYLKIPA
jgi:membrane associated rhomboid family serine protease